jgi:hypothetical protein
MKKLLLLTLTFFLPISVNAYDFSIDGICYTITSETDFTVEVARNNSTPYSGEIVIPEQVTKNSQTYTVTGVGEQAFFNCENLSSLTIPKTVINIVGNPFVNTYNLTCVTVAADNPSFRSEDGVLFTKDGVLLLYPSGKADQEYLIPDGTTTINTGAFSSCKNLRVLKMHNSVKEIKERAFYNTLEEITLSESLESIGAQAFSHLSISTINLPLSLKRIGDDAFNGCDKLKSIFIPESVEYIEDKQDAIGWCTGMETIDVDPNNQYYSSIDGVLYNKDVTKLMRCPSCNPNVEWFEIPQTVTTISSCAFHTVNYLTRLTIPSGLTSIGTGAFYYCRNLNRVTCYAQTPPTTPNRPSSSQDPWEYSGRGESTLYVPKGTKAAYQSFSCHDLYRWDIYPWAKFKEIIEMDDNSGVSQICTDSVLISFSDTYFSIKGGKDGDIINVYATNGSKIGSAVIENGTARIKTSIQPSSVAVVKIGDKSVKVIVK